MKPILSLTVGVALLGGSSLARPSLASVNDAGRDPGRPRAAAGADAPVLQWNEIAVQAVGATPPFPSTRAMAIVQVAVFEAVNAVTHRYTPYLGTLSAPDGASAEAAVVTAAHDTLLWLFPAQQGFLDDKQTESLATIPDGPAKDDGMAVGRDAAAAMIANRTGDGSSPAQFYAPARRRAVPVAADPQLRKRPGQQPRPVLPLAVRQTLRHPELGAVSRAAAARARQRTLREGFRGSEGVGDAASTLRPPDRADVAKLFAAQPPHRGWNMVARQLAAARHDDITRTARTLAVMNMSLSDAHITVFETKYFYRTWRPETAIRRADEDGNPRTSRGPGLHAVHRDAVLPELSLGARRGRRRRARGPRAGLRSQGPRPDDHGCRGARYRAPLHGPARHHGRRVRRARVRRHPLPLRPGRRRPDGRGDRPLRLDVTGCGGSKRRSDEREARLARARGRCDGPSRRSADPAQGVELRPHLQVHEVERPLGGGFVQPAERLLALAERGMRHGQIERGHVLSWHGAAPARTACRAPWRGRRTRRRRTRACPS